MWFITAWKERTYPFHTQLSKPLFVSLLGLIPAGVAIAMLESTLGWFIASLGALAIIAVYTISTRYKDVKR